VAGCFETILYLLELVANCSVVDLRRDAVAAVLPYVCSVALSSLTTMCAVSLSAGQYYYYYYYLFQLLVFSTCVFARISSFKL